MKMDTHRYKIDAHGFRNSKAQAIAEMAVFSSLFIFVLSLLVQYGLQYNNQQEVEMKAFRKSLAKALDVRGTSLQANYTVVEDKPTADLNNVFGFRERRPFTSSSSMSWSNQLMTSILPDCRGADTNPKNGLIDDAEIPVIEADLAGYLPRVYYKINDGITSGWQGDSSKRECEYTTAGIVTYGLSQVNKIKFKASDWEDTRYLNGETKEDRGECDPIFDKDKCKGPTDGIYWYWFEVSPSVLRKLPFDNENEMYIPVLNTSATTYDSDDDPETAEEPVLKEDDTVTLVFNDGSTAEDVQILKFVIILNSEIGNPLPVSCDIVKFITLDPHAGDIDFARLVQDDNGSVRVPGLTMEADKRTILNNQLNQVKEQGNSTEAITSRIGLGYEPGNDRRTSEIITRRVSKRYGPGDQVTSVFRHNRTHTWTMTPASE